MFTRDHPAVMGVLVQREMEFGSPALASVRGAPMFEFLKAGGNAPN